MSALSKLPARELSSFAFTVESGPGLRVRGPCVASESGAVVPLPCQQYKTQIDTQLEKASGKLASLAYPSQIAVLLPHIVPRATQAKPSINGEAREYGMLLSSGLTSRVSIAHRRQALTTAASFPQRPAVYRYAPSQQLQRTASRMIWLLRRL